MEPKMPLEMAQCAREKLQASAREIWSSIRSFDDVARKTETDSPQSADSAAVMSLERIENVFKVMFGSCTSGGVTPTSPEAELPPSSKPFEKRARSRDIVSGEHVYAQLFMDDQARAFRAVDGLRERAASSPRSRPGSQLRHSLPKTRSSGWNAAPVTPPTAKAIDIVEDFSFDDGISAISAHTLEDMARIHDHKAHFYSKNGFVEKRTSNPAEQISYPVSHRRRVEASSESPQTTSPGHATPSPVKFTRGRSSGTMGSKGTKSTKSSHDSEFVSVWKKEERKYWDDVVQQDRKVDKKNSPKTGKQALFKKGQRRSRCSSLSTKHDITITTASSSSYSNFSSHYEKHSHPHDVIHFDTRDILGSQDIFYRDIPMASLDASRIQKRMVVPYGSELGEI